MAADCRKVYPVPGPQTERWADLYYEILYGKESKGPKVKQLKKLAYGVPIGTAEERFHRGMEGQMGGKGFYEDSFERVCVLVCSYS